MFMLKFFIVLILVMTLNGCGVVKLAPGQVQKQNAWLLQQTVTAANQQAVTEQSSQQLINLTALAVDQSQAVVLDYGMPDITPASDIDSLLNGQTKALADEAIYWSGGGGDSDFWLNLLMVILSLVSGAAGNQYLGTIRRKVTSIMPVKQ